MQQQGFIIANLKFLTIGLYLKGLPQTFTSKVQKIALSLQKLNGTFLFPNTNFHETWKNKAEIPLGIMI